jgi:hypothetical protein
MGFTDDCFTDGSLPSVNPSVLCSPTDFIVVTDGINPSVKLDNVVVYLLTDLQISSVSAPIIWCDNLGATYLSANPVFHAHTKHVEVNYHFIQDRVAKKEIQIRFISSRDQLVDVFTEPLPTSSFTAFRFKLRVDPPHST